MKIVRVIQLTLLVMFLALILVAWLIHFYGTGETYVHLNVAVFLTCVGILGIVLLFLE